MKFFTSDGAWHNLTLGSIWITVHSQEFLGQFTTERET